MTDDNDEEYIGGITRITAEQIGDSQRTFYCPNCAKGVHCRAGVKDGTKTVEIIIDRCNNDKCECKCRRFYSYDGTLYKYGTKLPVRQMPPTDASGRRNHTDDLIEQINKDFRKC